MALTSPRNNGNTRSTKDMTIPATGVRGYNGVLKGFLRDGFFLSFRREKLTKANTRVDPKLAA